MMGTEADFDISTTTRNGTPVVEVRGELDVATAPRLRQQLEQLTATAGGSVGLCVVDLSAVTFVDSTALGALISASHMCRQAGGELRLVVTDPHVAKVFAITGLDDVFAMHTDAGSALRGA